MNTIDELLTKLNACEEAQDWSKGKTFVEIYTTCYRGDWLNWLFSRTNPEDVQLMILVKGHQANTVRHLMTDERSIKAIDTAIEFGEGKVTGEELCIATDAAWAAYTAAANASYTAARAAAWAARVESASSAAWAAAASAAAARAASRAASASADASYVIDASYATDARTAAHAAATAYNAAAVSYATAAAYNAAEASYAAADAHAAAARQANQQLTADIFRKYISIEKFNI